MTYRGNIAFDRPEKVKPPTVRQSDEERLARARAYKAANKARIKIYMHEYRKRRQRADIIE